MMTVADWVILEGSKVRETEQAMDDFFKHLLLITNKRQNMIFRTRKNSALAFRLVMN